MGESKFEYKSDGLQHDRGKKKCCLLRGKRTLFQRGLPEKKSGLLAGGKSENGASTMQTGSVAGKKKCVVRFKRKKTVREIKFENFIVEGRGERSKTHTSSSAKRTGLVLLDQKKELLAPAPSGGTAGAQGRGKGWGGCGFGEEWELTGGYRG